MVLFANSQYCQAQCRQICKWPLGIHVRIHALAKLPALDGRDGSIVTQFPDDFIHKTDDDIVQCRVEALLMSEEYFTLNVAMYTGSSFRMLQPIPFLCNAFRVVPRAITGITCPSTAPYEI